MHARVVVRADRPPGSSRPLERSARRAEFLLETDADGAAEVPREPDLRRGVVGSWARPSTGSSGPSSGWHREWRFCGDDGFLRELWPAAVRTLEYAIREWDRDGDGLPDGELHNTYDIEVHGIEPLAESHVPRGARVPAHGWRRTSATPSVPPTGTARGDRTADCHRRPAVERRILPVQAIDDVDAHRYQYGEGILLGPAARPVPRLRQWPRRPAAPGTPAQHAHRHRAAQLQVGSVRPREHAAHLRAQRRRRPAPGLVAGRRTAGHSVRVLRRGLDRRRAPGRRLPHLRRSRRRRPSCSSAHCAGATTARHAAPGTRSSAATTTPGRSSSWALLLAMSGAQWDAPTATLSFAPARDGRYLFTTGTGWGRAEIDGDALRLDNRRRRSRPRSPRSCTAAPLAGPSRSPPARATTARPPTSTSHPQESR